MNLNITSDMTPEQILIEAHKSVAIPTLLIGWIATIILFLIIGLFSIDGSRGSNPYRRFMIIWTISIFISGLIVLFLASSPFAIQKISGWITILWN
ncbi:MAG: hypothetical protein AABY22_13740 [Nanoarchaeota archaeon]